MSWTANNWNSPTYSSCTNNPNCNYAENQNGPTPYYSPDQGYDDISCSFCEAPQGGLAGVTTSPPRIRPASLHLRRLQLSPGSGVSKDSLVTTATELLPDGHVRLVVTNRSHQPVTALYAIAQGTPLVQGISETVSHRFFDSVIDIFSQKDLEPLQDYVFVFAGPHPGPSKLHIDASLQAALFADGTSWGDSTGVETLISRRKFMLHYVEAALNMLREAKSNGTARQALEEQFQTRLDGPSPTAKADERLIARAVFGEVLASLHMDETAVASALPMDQRINSIISQLRHRQQKLLWSKPALVGALANPAPAR